MVRRLTLGVLLLLVVASVAEAADPRLESSPAALVAGEMRRATLRVEGLSFAGPLAAAVSEGRVLSVSAAGGGATVEYEMPQGRHPRRVCLLVWRDAPGGEVAVLRFVLLGRTKLPVRTRRNSQVKVRVGERTFGPVSSGRRGRVRVPALVPPGVTRAEVEVTDRAGLKSHKTVPIRQRSYGQLALAVVPSKVTGKQVQVQLVVAAADAAEEVMLTAAGGALEVKQAGPLRWQATWSPIGRPSEGDHEMEASAAAGGKRQLARATVSVMPRATFTPAQREGNKASSGPTATVTKGAAAPPPRALRGVVGAGLGVFANFGALTSPRFLLEAGVEYRLARLALGARLQAGLSWSSQDIAEPAPLQRAESSVLLVPLSLAFTLRYPMSFVSPYLAPALVGQVVRTKNSGEGVDDVVRNDFVVGFSILAGISRAIGPGRLFFQGGYLFGKLDVEEVYLPAGGLVIEAGYRFLL